jgi:hypothetical protein
VGAAAMGYVYIRSNPLNVPSLFLLFFEQNKQELVIANGRQILGPSSHCCRNMSVPLGSVLKAHLESIFTAEWQARALRFVLIEPVAK